MKLLFRSSEVDMNSKIVGLLLCIAFQTVELLDSDNNTPYTNTWAAHIVGGPEVAKRVAEEHGYEVVKKLRVFEDHYLLKHNELPRRSKRGADQHTKRLAEDDRVQWVEQQIVKSLVKRDVHVKRSSEQRFNDELWKDQWYLRDTRAGDLSLPKLDLNVLRAWDQNITGAGVVVCVLDDGLEHSHPDLAANYDPYASTDLNSNDEHDFDPSPRYDKTNENKHGTRCAGEIAMVANNSVCGVGVAYNAKIGGVRMLDGEVTDHLEAEAIAFNCSHIDIYSASWGPSDDGRTVEGPGTLALAAFEKGIKEGRMGKGVIYAWASGNGGKGDNCDCDGYTGSIYTISISSASEQCREPWYGEKCASTLATAYSSGAYTDQKIMSTDLHNKCTKSHTGTSAAAPLAAGIFALVLSANNNLTWRDMQHLVVWTAESSTLHVKTGWKQNGAGFNVSSAFGFGLLNADSMVEAAKNWVSVPTECKCSVVSTEESNLPIYITSKQELEIDIYTNGCKDQVNEINYLEHVELQLTMAFPIRGHLSIDIISAEGHRTMLLSERSGDRSEAGFDQWKFMSVHSWAEHPTGTWKLRIRAKDSTDVQHGQVQSVKLILHGTKTRPEYLNNGPRVYNTNYNDEYTERMIQYEGRRSKVAKLSDDIAILREVLDRTE